MLSIRRLGSNYCRPARVLRTLTALQVGALATIVFASFSLGIVTSRAYDHYARQAACQRWQANVDRWSSMVNDPLDAFYQTESRELVGMIAVRNQVCGY